MPWRSKLRAVIEQVQEFGCVVKDLDTGLIDFPTLLRGWKSTSAGSWGSRRSHSGMAWTKDSAGRKAIDQDFLDHHRGDRAH
jgi:hypothetical protein